MRKQILASLVVLSGAAWVPLVLGQDSVDAGDPPGRAARLSWIDGNVSFQPGGVEDWVPATLNLPLTTGDRVWADTGARAELLLGTAAFRLGARTNFTFLNLTDYAAQVQLSSGTLSVRVRSLADQENIEIDTPHAAFSLLQPGEYRIDVSESGDATIATVRSGQSDVVANEQNFRIGPFEQVRIGERNGSPEFDRRPPPVADGFDNWCQLRDRREDMSQSGLYVSHDIPGYADLDDNGVWRNDAQYAWTWFPRVTPGWVPYRFGHWAWIEPWGWNWVDDAPWGYAPFHYGRWVFAGSAWGWVPGPVVVRPAYCPALVAWVGGAGFSLGFSVGGPPVGWFPLGPREIWMPPYRHSPNYIEHVNITNTVIVNRAVFNHYDAGNADYRNRHVPGGVTAVSRDVFASGHSVGSAAQNVPGDALGRAQVRSFADVAPQRGSVLGGRMPAGVEPPRALMNRGFVARAAPPPAPVPFDQRQAALQANPGRPLDRGTVDQIRQRQPQPPRPAIRQTTPPAAQIEGGQPQQLAPRAAPQPGERFPRRTEPQPQRFPAPDQQPPQPAPAPQPRMQPRSSAPPAQQPPAVQPSPQTQPRPRGEFRRVPQAPPPQPQTQQPAPAPAPRQFAPRRVPQAPPQQPQVQQPPPQSPPPQPQRQPPPQAPRGRRGAQPQGG